MFVRLIVIESLCNCQLVSRSLATNEEEEQRSEEGEAKKERKASVQHNNKQ
jgi:hypothetical protein